MAFKRNGVTVDVVGRITFDKKTGYTCHAKARGARGDWEHATATGDSLAKAREKAYDLATAEVVRKGNVT